QAGAIELEPVAFTCDGIEPVLADVSLRIEPGERVAIVGASGSGKTTLALLLARFHDPSAGAVRIGGHDLRACRLSSVHDTVSFVFEEGFLFATTSADIIPGGRPTA